MNIGDYIVSGIMVILIGIFVYVIYDEQVNTHLVCHEEAIVLDILKVHYRSATILTDKGEKILNQATIKDGDVICLRNERVRNEE
ncbi:hypothetical protein LCGC14_2560800 [marine sediment metagenome]|uniref:Uncharacterized protein n=1 Tax=marine sediment metagenome TaxID=412755 RepID=A0A0F9DD74_9ZZZZ